MKKKTRKQKRASIVQELERIRAKNSGILLPAAVVRAAKKPSNILHNCFDWDDASASHQWRLWQARQLIAAVVIYEPRTDTEIRGYVSLREERGAKHGGYRSLSEALSNAKLREKVLAEALLDMELWQDKYQRLVELAPIFAAIKRVKAKRKKKK